MDWGAFFVGSGLVAVLMIWLAIILIFDSRGKGAE